MKTSTMGRLAALAFAKFVLFLTPGWAQNVTVYTSPIDITGGRLSITAFAPDRDSGAMVSRPIPPGTFGPRLTALTSVPINVLMDGRWNGTPAQVTAGTSPRQQACDGPSGVKAQVTRQASSNGSTAYNVNCNFGTMGQVFVKQVGSALYLSYQVFNNTATFRIASPLPCDPDRGSPTCSNDPSFEVRFAFELLTVIWTPSLCTIHAEPPNVYLHGVQIDSHNLAADLAMFYDAAFKDNSFLAGELAMQAREIRSPITIDDAFNELRSSAACVGSDAMARVFRTFSQLDTIITIPQGIELRATHPSIPTPRIQNVSLPYGVDTCVQGYVWREARIGDLACVSTETRSQTAADNAAATSRRVLQPPTIPSFTRPSITAPPVVAAGTSFPVSGQFFPPTLDPTTILIFLDRDGNSACFGGATEMETVRTGAAAVSTSLPATPGSLSSCNYRYDAKGLQSSAQYRFRARDCDAVTCSAWSKAFQTMTGSPSATSPVQLTLDSGVNLGDATTSAGGTFQANVTMPAGTTTGPHKLTGASGLASDSIGVQVTAGQSAASIIVTGAFYGDRGCPMRPAPNVIDAAESFTLFGSGFLPGIVNIRLDSASGTDLGFATAQADGTFCAYFSGPPFSATGAHNLVAVQSGSVRATLAVNVVINTPIH